jgi:ATP/maltotriose-dependent transcriptional regulator MalT
MLWLREALAEASGTATVGSTLAVAEQLIAAGDLRLGMQALFTAAVRCYMFKVDDALPAAVIRAARQVGLPAHDATFAAIRALADPARHAVEVADAVAGITPEAVMRTAPDAGAAADSMHLYALALTCVAEFRLGVGFQDHAIAAFRAQGRLGLLSRALGSHSVVRLDLADWSLATQAADECLRLTGYTPGVRGTATDGERVLNAGSCLLVLATVAANRGKPALAEQRLEEAVRVFGAAGSSYMLALVQAARTSVAMAEGRPAEAFQHAQRIFDPADVACHWPVSRGGPVLRDLADAATASGNTAQAKALLAGIDRNTATAEARGALAHADAVLAHEGAEQLFRAALAAAPSAVFFQARLHLAFGLWLRRQRRQMEARPYLRSATDGFDAIGAAPWAERARQELRASGETLRRGGADIRDELSPQEMQIAQLAAQGLTNREIGARLFVSHRTIGSHLYKIFPKLGIRSRAELAAALAQTPAAAAATQGSAGEQPVAPRA